jgi:hypothetical protein
VGSSSFPALTRPTGPLAPLSHLGLLCWSVESVCMRRPEKRSPNSKVESQRSHGWNLDVKGACVSAAWREASRGDGQKK